jgi:succinylglutamate desuccinylase
VQNWSDTTLQSELNKFRGFTGLVSNFGQIELLAEDIIKFSPNTEIKTKVNAGFMALVHGNEILGLPILNQILENLLNGQLKTSSDLYFALGNIQAAFADKRFLEKDLNRCFNEKSEETLENRRALVLEKYFLDKVDYLLDLHQTVQKSDTAFFIFQYSSLNCLSHLSLMNTNTPTILQFENIGDQKGLSSDEYVRLRGRFGTTLELAQIGLNQTYFKLGYSACEKLILNLGLIENFESPLQPTADKLNYEIFEISNRIVATHDKSILNSELKNFSFVEKNQPIGRSEEAVVTAPESGLLLFPKLDQLVQKNQTLAFLCKELQVNSLPTQNLATQPTVN